MLKKLIIYGHVWNRKMNSTYTHLQSTTFDSLTKRIYDGILKGDRQCLSKAITLVESTHPNTYSQSQMLLDKLLKSSKYNYDNNFMKNALDNRNKAKNLNTLRIAVTGPPGAGKSSFIEVLGEYVIENMEFNVAVLTVDPSSPISGGSVLGDKTHMRKLSVNPKAYVRPSPSGCNLGGVTRTTQEAIMLCEAAGYNLVLVETVGVGQSEYSVSNMVDLVMLLVSPAAGDGLQAIKRGIMEIVNIIVVNKYDTNFKVEVEKTANQYKHSLGLMRSTIPEWKTQVHMVSSLTHYGIDNVWESIDLFWKKFGQQSDFLEQRRAYQRCQWFRYHLDTALKDHFLKNKKIKENMKQLEKQVIDQVVTPGRASDILVSMFVENPK